MVKCVVSGCPNRMVSVNRGVFNRPRKRFFNFPKDPTRVKVWLAALRETDQQDFSDQHLICEDHFLPEDISANGINRDAIPIMPPYLDGTLGLVNPWGDESSEEEEEEEEDENVEEEEEEEEEEDEEESGDDAPPAPDPPQQSPGGGVETPPEVEKTSVSLPQRKQSDPSQRFCRPDVSLRLLTLRFLKLLLAAPDGALDLRDVVANLQTHKVYDITDVLNSLNLLQEKSPHWVKWIGKIPISSFLWKTQQQFQREMDNLKLVEDRLDGLIRSCSQQLFNMTDDAGNSKAAYVTHEDIRRLRSVQQQTVIIVKSPEETKMEIPTPQEDNIQIHLKAEKGPIVVLTCEMGSADAVTSDLGCFLRLEESRVRSTTLHTAT